VTTDRATVPSLVPAIVLAVGMAAAGLFVGHGFSSGRAADRFVEVKGLAETDVEADLALWPLRFVATDNDLAQAQAQIGRYTRQVMAFLAKNGVDTTTAELQNLEVSDGLANRYQPSQMGPRFIIQQTLMVRSREPKVVLAASQRVSELVSSGVVLQQSGEYGMGGPTFVFTGLNALKPDMIATATANARAAAEQFARDSRSALGDIRQANQGVFVILPRDQAPGAQEGSQLNKTVRVVSTVQYFLK
jgi:uncharacterized protein